MIIVIISLILSIIVMFLSLIVIANSDIDNLGQVMAGAFLFSIGLSIIIITSTMLVILL